MKKYILLILLALSVTGVVAQENQTTKDSNSDLNGFNGPTAGDFAIGVDAVPYIEFVGNMFNGTTNNTLNVGQTTLYGKYYLDSKSAVRAELFINNIKDQNTNYVQDQSQLNNPDAQVEDLQIINSKGFGLGLGYQMYVGDRKLRGFYGGAIAYNRNRLKHEYMWGNQMTVDNTTPISSTWVNNFGGSTSERNVYYDQGISQTLSIGAIAGAEYFINNYVSIGAEAGIYMAYNWNTQADRKYETIEQGIYREKELALAPSESTYSLRTQVYDASRVAGRLYILFHF